MPQPTAITRLTLLPTAPRERPAEAPKIRRYRLASLPPAGTTGATRFAHLKRTYD